MGFTQDTAPAPQKDGGSPAIPVVDAAPTEKEPVLEEQAPQSPTFRPGKYVKVTSADHKDKVGWIVRYSENREKWQLKIKSKFGGPNAFQKIFAETVELHDVPVQETADVAPTPKGKLPGRLGSSRRKVAKVAPSKPAPRNNKSDQSRAEKLKRKVEAW